MKKGAFHENLIWFMTLTVPICFRTYFLLYLTQNLFGLMNVLCQQNRGETFKQKCQDVDNKCVCQICTCKKHHCPPKHLQFEADTTNHHDYKAYNIIPDHPRKCGYAVNQSSPYDPGLLKSTYKVDYIGHQAEQAHYQSKYAYQPNKSKFYDETQYKKSYVQNPIQVSKPIQCTHQYRPNTGKFDGNTTYKVNYTGKQTDQVQLRKHYAYQSNNLPFNGHTTYGDSYQRYLIEGQRPRTCCPGQYVGSPGKFQGKSCYRDQFKGLQNPRSCRCLVEELPPRPRQCSPGKDHLHFCAPECSWK